MVAAVVAQFTCVCPFALLNAPVVNSLPARSRLPVAVALPRLRQTPLVTLRAPAVVGNCSQLWPALVLASEPRLMLEMSSPEPAPLLMTKTPYWLERPNTLLRTVTFEPPAKTAPLRLLFQATSPFSVEVAPVPPGVWWM